MGEYIIKRTLQMTVVFFLFLVFSYLLFKNLGENQNLKELTVTTNASQLKKKAPMLIRSGVKRINIRF